MNPAEPTLLTHLNEARTGYFAEGGLSNVIFCGKFKADTDVTSIMQTHRKVVEDEVNNESSNVTGILIVQGNSLVHLLEGPCFSILRILKDLSTSDDFTESNIQSGSIVYSVEDCPQRYFPEWYSVVVQEINLSVDELNEYNCKDVVHELAMNMLEIGKGLHLESSEDINLSKYSDQLPGKKTVLILSESSLFFSLEEYVSLYAGPYDIDLESEQTWPPEKLVSYH